MKKNKKKSEEISKETASKLIDVAIDLFSRKGFAGTSIRDIAAQMGMTSSNIYHHFGTKEGLLRAIEQQTYEPITRELRRIASLDMPPLERFSLLIKTQLSNLYAHRKEGLFLATPNAETLPPDRKDLNNKIQRETFFIYRSEIERVLSSMGRKGDPTVAAFCTLGSIIWFLRWYNPQGKRAFDKLSDSIIKHVLYGIIGTGCPEVRASIE